MKAAENHKPRAGICFNLKRNTDSDSDEEYDEIETIEFLKVRLERFGFEVLLAEQDEYLFDKLYSGNINFVLNIAEGKGKNRSRESQVPGILEWLNIPYYGSDPASLAITLDKWLTYVILKNASIPVPQMHMVEGVGQLQEMAIPFDGRKYIVKPRWEGSSKGIFNDSVVSTITKCRDKVSHVISEYNQPALVEEFVEQEEITAGICGNEALEILGMMKISQHEALEAFIYSIENKRDWRSRIKYERAEGVVAEKTLKSLRQYAMAAFKVLGLRDAARIDFRVDNAGIPKIIDVNPLPGLSPKYSDLMLMSKLHNKKFVDVIDKILTISLKRNSIHPR
ncbi:MAG: ATP-grasp domain-containing protein [Candidatus Omnitrophica bacterium]|nr:ATP-grasp domain-containing protein [Candidatus Omnitrophota bacterium]